MRDLTKAEEQIMQVLWKLEKAFVKEIIEELPEPKPAYNTVSTVVRILEEKQVVGHIAHGKTHQYYPLFSKKDYQNFYMKNFIKNYFGGSFQKMVSFFVKENQVNLNDMEDLLQYMDNLPPIVDEEEQNPSQ
ncbi:MAG: BlaI/MecI/CopY family transcriptional regulator [Cytophagales bacterium]|nr:MAG: BlaI/MecI/CopY family transcriptional regulator [Cytophagales bacterium]